MGSKGKSGEQSIKGCRMTNPREIYQNSTLLLPTGDSNQCNVYLANVVNEIMFKGV